MIAVIDYGAGNLQSVEKALRHIGCACEITADPECLLSADAAILPGVGAFGDAMENLRSRGLEKPIHQLSASGKPFQGICLGLQIASTCRKWSENSPYWLEFSALGEVRRTLSGIDGRTLRLLCAFLLPAGGREYHYFYHKVWSRNPCFRAEGQCICLPVPSGKEWGDRLADSA